MFEPGIGPVGGEDLSTTTSAASGGVVPEWCADPSRVVDVAPVPPSGEVAALAAAVQAVCASSVADISAGDGATVEADLLALTALAQRLEAAVLARVAVIDARGAGRTEGAASTHAWLTARTGVSSGRAGALVAGARRLRELPVVLDAALAGTVSTTAAVTLAALADPLHPDLVARARGLQDELVTLAARLPVRRLRAQVSRLREALASDVAAADAEHAFERRRLAFSRFDDTPGTGGMGVLDGLLDRETTELLATCLDVTMAADRVENDPRSTPQRRHDAFAQLLRAAAGAGTLPTAGWVRPHLVVVADLERLVDPATAETVRVAAGASTTPPSPAGSTGAASPTSTGASTAPPFVPATFTGTDGADGDPLAAAGAAGPPGGLLPGGMFTGPADRIVPAGIVPAALPITLPAAAPTGFPDVPPAGLLAAAPAGIVTDKILTSPPAGTPPGGLPGTQLVRTGHLLRPAARRLGCDALLTTILTDGPGRILTAGRTTRLATPAQRAALLVRDGGCRFPGCDRPPGWCEAHHILHWADGGPTDLTNLVLLCWLHHHHVHERGWTVTLDDDGSVEWTRPRGGLALSTP